MLYKQCTGPPPGQAPAGRCGQAGERSGLMSLQRLAPGAPQAAPVASTSQWTRPSEASVRTQYGAAQCLKAQGAQGGRPAPVTTAPPKLITDGRRSGEARGRQVQAGRACLFSSPARPAWQLRSKLRPRPPTERAAQVKAQERLPPPQRT